MSETTALSASLTLTAAVLFAPEPTAAGTNVISGIQTVLSSSLSWLMGGIVILGIWHKILAGPKSGIVVTAATLVVTILLGIIVVSGIVDCPQQEGCHASESPDMAPETAKPMDRWTPSSPRESYTPIDMTAGPTASGSYSESSPTTATGLLMETSIATGRLQPTPMSDKHICQPLPLKLVVGIVDWAYLVKPGDTIPKLAETFLGDPELWEIIFDANRQFLGPLPGYGIAPPLLFGQLLIIPGVESPINYTIREGDTVEGVMTTHYGYGAEYKWCTLYSINPKLRGEDPRLLHAGVDIDLYPLPSLEENQIWVLPGERIIDYALAYYLDQGEWRNICRANNLIGDDCEVIVPFDLIILPNLPASTTYVAEPGDSWERIANWCFGKSDPVFVYAIKLANRRRVGIEPPEEGPQRGQVLRLWKCNRDF